MWVLVAVITCSNCLFRKTFLIKLLVENLASSSSLISFSFSFSFSFSSLEEELGVTGRTRSDFVRSSSLNFRFCDRVSELVGVLRAK